MKPRISSARRRFSLFLARRCGGLLPTPCLIGQIYLARKAGGQYPRSTEYVAVKIFPCSLLGRGGSLGFAVAILGLLGWKFHFINVPSCARWAVWGNRPF